MTRRDLQYLPKIIESPIVLSNVWFQEIARQERGRAMTSLDLMLVLSAITF